MEQRKVIQYDKLKIKHLTTAISLWHSRCTTACSLKLIKSARFQALPRYIFCTALIECMSIVHAMDTSSSIGFNCGWVNIDFSLTASVTVITRVGYVRYCTGGVMFHTPFPAY